MVRTSFCDPVFFQLNFRGVFFFSFFLFFFHSPQTHFCKCGLSLKVKVKILLMCTFLISVRIIKGNKWCYCQGELIILLIPVWGLFPVWAKQCLSIKAYCHDGVDLKVCHTKRPKANPPFWGLEFGIMVVASLDFWGWTWPFLVHVHLLYVIYYSPSILRWSLVKQI